MSRPAVLPFWPCLQFPYRETLLNRRPRHTPGTRHTLRRRAGIRFGPWGVCRRMPSFFSQLNSSNSRGEMPVFYRRRYTASRGLRQLSGRWCRAVVAFGVARCSFRQIVAFFWPIANRFLMNGYVRYPAIRIPELDVTGLNAEPNRPYTKCGPIQSHITC
jgi:hypothetical protein